MFVDIQLGIVCWLVRLAWFIQDDIVLPRIKAVYAINSLHSQIES